jgi:hypothetical protein
MSEQIGKAALENALEAARSRSSEPAEILFLGSGWGNLETHAKRRACFESEGGTACPPAFPSPANP